MKNFIKLIKEKDKKVTDSFVVSELKNFEKMHEQIEVQHQQIIEDTKNVDYLLDLIVKHNISIDKPIKHQENSNSKKEFEKLTSTLEKYHVMETSKLSKEDLEFLKSEKSKLLFEEARLQKEHKNIHKILAESTILLINAREFACKELSNGHSIASVSEKLLENFGKKIKNEYGYYSGRKQIMQFLENTLLINKIKSKGLFEILEKSKVIKFKIDTPKNNLLFDFDNFDGFTSEFLPLVSSWYINA